MTFEQLVPRQRAFIELVITDLGRHYLLAAAEQVEFRTLVLQALERNESELLRTFDQRADWETYLRTVITREFYQFQNTLWGTWRPSLGAVHLGPAGVLLEELMQRDGLTLARATDVMRRMHRVDLGPHSIAKLALALELSDLPSTVDDHLEARRVAMPTAHRLQGPLHHALTQLSPDDRLMLQLALRDRQPLTRIARLLRVDVRPLQRQLEVAKQALAGLLRDQGVATEDIEAVLNPELAETTQMWHAIRSRPST